MDPQAEQPFLAKDGTMDYLPMAQPVAIPIAATGQTMDRALGDAPGLLIRERFFWSQVLCAACERKTQFKVAAWDPSMPARLTDEHYTTQQPIMEINEESTCLCRYCCHQFRELQLGVFAPGGGDASMGYTGGWPHTQPEIEFRRPYKCPCVCCCYMPWPGEMNVYQQNSFAGRAVQDWKWWNCCWPCSMYINVYDQRNQHEYIVHTPRACGSGGADSKCCVNCCAPSCFNPIHTAYIMRGNDPVTPIGIIENQWPGCNMRGICMANSAADNFVIKFPNNATTQQKALLLGAWGLSNFLFWERRGNQK